MTELNLLVPNPTIYATDLINGRLDVMSGAGATYTLPEGGSINISITSEGLIIDLHTDDTGNPASLSMSWDEWADHLLENGVR